MCECGGPRTLCYRQALKTEAQGFGVSVWSAGDPPFCGKHVPVIFSILESFQVELADHESSSPVMLCNASSCLLTVHLQGAAQNTHNTLLWDLVFLNR